MTSGQVKRRTHLGKTKKSSTQLEEARSFEPKITNLVTAHLPGNHQHGGKEEDLWRGEKGKMGKGKCCCLWSYEELPEYMKDNEFIHKYYRVEWPLKEAFFSLFQWHNETLNVWTHLLGFGLFLGLTIFELVSVPQVGDLLGMFRSSPSGTAETNISLNSKQPHMGAAKLLDLDHMTNLGYDGSLGDMLAERWPFYVFLGGSMLCLLSSSICHLFSCHSYHLSTQLFRVDYFGITIMIITSFFPPIFYIFQCNPVWQIVYLSIISLLGFFIAITLLSPTLSSGEYRGFRAILFVSMAFFGIFPAIHGILLNWDNPKRNVTLLYESLMALFYLVGTGFYVSRVPERFKPGWFDLAGHSHQIFHVFVVLGALAHYVAAQEFLKYRDIVGCDAGL
ncbi:Heptahelical transmembrane protein 1-like protein [Drosera capensis]